MFRKAGFSQSSEKKTTMSGKSHRSRGERDRSDDHPRKQPTSQEPPKLRPVLDEFFLDGDGIDRQVLQSSICRFLGPEATSKPHEYEVCTAPSCLLIPPPTVYSLTLGIRAGKASRFVQFAHSHL